MQGTFSTDASWQMVMRITFLWILAMMIFGCYEKQEGCLDLAATNFDVAADKPCSECCTYPKWKIGLLHRLQASDSTGSLLLGAVYPVLPDSAQWFRMEHLRFYLSRFRLVTVAGDTISTVDSLACRLLRPGEDTTTTFLKENFAYIDRSITGEKTLGTILGSGQIDKILCTFGILDNGLFVLPGSVPAGHPLSFQPPDSSNWDLDTKYIFNRIQLKRDTTTSAITTDIRLVDPQIVTLEFRHAFTLKPGHDLSLDFRIDYLEWLRGVDLGEDSDQEIALKILANLPRSVTLIGVRQ